MNDQEKKFFMNHLTNLQLSMSIVDYLTVSQNWRDLNFTPDFDRFYFIKDGEGYIKIGSEELYPNPNQLILLPGGIKQSYSTISEQTFTKYFCHFTATIGDLNLFQILKLPRVIDIEETEFLEQLFQGLIDHHMSEELTAVLQVKLYLLKIVCYFIEHIEMNQIQLSGFESLEIVNDILKYIESRLNENITVEELAKIAHFNPNYFIHFFHKMTGSSPLQYINKLKIEKAKNLLSTSNLSISEIADSIGFQLFYFSRIFKNSTGFSPTAYRSFVKK